MTNNGFKIIAKSNIKESYLIAYAHKDHLGFMVDFETGVLSPDGPIQSLRKDGIWLDYRCSENIERRILGKVASLKNQS